MSYVQNETIRALRERKALTKSHYISFIAWVSNDRAELVKLYPEQDITVRFKKRGHGTVYAYCNRDELFSRRL